MPNWCKNVLTVLGNPEAIEAFIRENAGPLPVYRSDAVQPERDDTVWPLVFSAQAPPPEEVLEQGYSDAGYDWQIENWGTKWEPEDTIVERIEGGVRYTFLTAWSPPVQWLKTVGEIYDTLTFDLHYAEPGLNLSGAMMIEKGEILFSDDEAD